jgi:ferredoxin
MYVKKLVLNFPTTLVDKPIIYKLSKDYNIEFNILKASVTPKEEGLLVLELKGEESDYQQAIKYLQREGVKVQTLAQDVTRDEEKCIHCGLCIPLCPVSAFEMEENSFEVVFNKDKCIACEICVKVCPYKAMGVKL